jgi:glycine hydroxymethyltransferase
MKDKKIQNLVIKEQKRQMEQIGLIPSENYASKEVREAVGSVFMNKYSEGQVGKRYYQGNTIIDELEALVKKRALSVFGLLDNQWLVNVQALSGTPANIALYNAILAPGDTILTLYLLDGGHLSHGWMYKNKKITLTSSVYNIAYYHVDPKSFLLDYKEILRIAKECRPKLIISGGTAYPRNIDYKEMADIAHTVGAYYLADVAHEAGLIAGKALPSPFPYADFVTMTTHKTLRGPRGAIIFSRLKFGKAVDKSVFPGLQGGPHNHTIAGIGIALYEAAQPSFQHYSNQVIRNTQVLARSLSEHGFTVMTGGTDKHLVLLDLRNKEISGKEAAEKLEKYGIITNANTIPYDTNPPFKPSGLRLGAPAVTTRGMREKDMKQIGEWIALIINKVNDPVDKSLSDLIKKFALKFPVPK